MAYVLKIETQYSGLGSVDNSAKFMLKYTPERFKIIIIITINNNNNILKNY